MLSTATSVDSSDAISKPSAPEGSKEVCTSTVTSKSSSPIKGCHLSANDAVKYLTSDEDEVEPAVKNLRCTIDTERLIMDQDKFSQRLLKFQFPKINGLESTLL